MRLLETGVIIYPDISETLSELVETEQAVCFYVS